ncbi:12268_t:CDS:2 [Entrophospora sp. SA101]|nr:12268_t:CDS:2 [Entrophospora sp. SA101]
MTAKYFPNHRIEVTIEVSDIFHWVPNKLSRFKIKMEQPKDDCSN